MEKMSGIKTLKKLKFKLLVYNVTINNKTCCYYLLIKYSQVIFFGIDETR